jgi:hypothetical protein
MNLLLLTFGSAAFFMMIVAMLAFLPSEAQGDGRVCEREFYL